MTKMQFVLRSKREQILQTAAQHGVRRVRVFGSVARGTDDEHSDIDFLVEMAPDRNYNYITVMEGSEQWFFKNPDRLKS